MATTLATASLLVYADMSKVRGQITSGTKSAAERAGTSSGAAFGDKFTGSVRSFSGRAASTVGALTSAVTGVGLAGLVTFGLKSAASLEQAQIGFETLLGSGKKASVFLAGLQKFAAQTPFELPGLIDASRTLLGVGLSANKVMPLLRAFGDTAGAVGIGQEAFQRIMIATSQSISAGRFSLQDLNQIMTNGIPIYTILSKALGKPVPEIRKMATAGKLLASDVLPLLQREMEKDYGGAMARQSQTLAGVWSTLKDTVAIGLASALKPLVPLLSDFIPKAAAAAGSALTTASAAMVSILAAFRTGQVTSSGFLGGIQSLTVAFHAALPTIREVGGAILSGLGTALSFVVPLVADIVGWMTRHRTATAALAITLLSLVATYKAISIGLAIQKAGLVAYLGLTNAVKVATVAWTAVQWLANGALGATKAVLAFNFAAWVSSTAAVVANTAALVAQRIASFAVAAATKVWAAGQWLLNVALTANPIGIVIVAIAALVAAVIIAWRNSETFRRVVTAAWVGIQTVVRAVVGWFTSSVLPVLRAVWDGIAAAANRMWVVTIRPVLNALVAFARGVVAPVALWLWHNVFQPAFTAIGWVVKAGIAVAQLAIAVYVAYLRNVVAPVAKWLWHNVISPVFNGIASVIRTHIAAARAILSGLIAFFRGPVATVVTWLYRNVFLPNFNAIRSVISGAWNFIRPILTSLGNFVKGVLVANFRTGVEAIKAIWKGIQAAARAPVVFVVRQVINPLIGGFNRVAKVFGTSQISPIGGFAEGGRIPGAPSSRDNRLGSLVGRGGKLLGPIKVATGEFIVNARDTAKALPVLRWINDGMRGGPMEVARRIGRPLMDTPGDGSEGWGFAKGGLVGFLSDVWGAVTNPGKLIKAPLEAMVKKIPGAGLLRDVLVGMGRKLISGLTGFLTGGGGAGAAGNVGGTMAFLRAQAGKPYIWASAGPTGYDCSGIVSAAYNMLHGKRPYSHTFSTEGLPGRWFREGNMSGPLIAGWSHPGQSPASSGTGHMAGNLAGMAFESRGSRGVVVGPQARSIGVFAHRGSAMADGGLVRVSKAAMADGGRVTLDRGWNLVGNGTGRSEHLSTGGGSDQVVAVLGAILDAVRRNPAAIADGVGRHVAASAGRADISLGVRAGLYGRTA